ncbi:MAG: hypothetical protein N3B21_15970 [Clostridia bacterium]|nr:hypothetical protein [Clostridia bacterium]
MNRKQIETLKSTLSRLAMQGCKIQSSTYGIAGRLVGIGFKPYWTNPADSKIEKLELNFIDEHGRIRPFYLYNIVGYDIVSYDGRDILNSKNISLDIRVFSPNKSIDKEPYDKISLEINQL